MLDFVIAASILRPGTSWSCLEISHEDGTIERVLTQADDEAPRVAVPTIEEAQKVVDAAAYQEARRQEYPVVEEQLDAIWDLLKDPNDSDAGSVAKTIDDIKVKYPKPGKDSPSTRI